MTTATQIQPGLDVRHYVAILRRRWLLVAVTAMVVLSGALVVNVTESPTWSASAEIVFTPAPTALPGT